MPRNSILQSYLSLRVARYEEITPVRTTTLCGYFYVCHCTKYSEGVPNTRGEVLWYSASMKKAPLEILKERLTEISHLSLLLGIVGWDQEVNMPPKAADAHANAEAELSGITHSKFVAINRDGLLTKLHKEVLSKKLRGKDAIVVEETWRSYERERTLPEAFVKELRATTSKAQHVWGEARKENNFKKFLPWLEKIVALKRQEAQYVGFKNSPYDALLDTYEPGMTTEEASMILNDLKDFLIPYIQKLKSSRPKKITGKTKGKFPQEKQVAFNTLIAKSLGFDFDAGRLDASAHPFTMGAHPHDVRITTRYKEDDLLYSLGSTIHEAGHGLYEQGLPPEHFGNPLGESISLGIHESQSRMWENQVGSSVEFWHHFYPKLQKEFPVPFKKLSLVEFYRIINEVKPTLVRTESDEVTYNLHIVIRFEIERELIEGSVEIKDLPLIWKAKVKEYLGIDVPNDTLGVLQDTHWSCGLFGYFPTYSFGNLYAAQFYAMMEKDIPNLKKLIKKGEFGEIRAWLRKHIHSKGKMHTAGELVKKVTGEPLNSRYFSDYIKKKYDELYLK